ncbi:hypothetical protein D3C72_1443880 [compost metagenome]
MSKRSKPGSPVKVEVGMRPYSEGSSVPCHGKKPISEPLLSFWYDACSVSEVSAFGRQVSEGAMAMRSSDT